MTEEQLETLMTAIRRQGRASMAAQAAAEACLEAVRAGSADGEARPARALLAALLLTFDALDRVQAEARVVRDTPRGALARLFGGPREDVDALCRAVELLGAQLEDALASAGVTRDAQAGGPVDPERHRVVQIEGAPEAEARVLEVVRAGYSIDGQRVREAEVVATPEETP